MEKLESNIKQMKVESEKLGEQVGKENKNFINIGPELDQQNEIKTETSVSH